MTDDRSEILSKRKMDSEIWYNHEYGCYMIKVDVWPKYPTQDKLKKSIIIKLNDDDLFWLSEGSNCPQVEIKKP